MTDLSPPAEIAPLFELAGWRHGQRALPLPARQGAHPAKEILAAFAGLVVRPKGEMGVDCAPSDIRFTDVEVNSSLISEWASRLAVDLVPVAEVHYSNDALLVATDGRCFGFGYVDDAFFFLGSSFWEAVARLLTGRRAKPMLLPFQDAVTLYGETFERNSPHLYEPSTPKARANTSEA